MSPRATLAAAGVVMTILVGAWLAVPDQFRVSGFTHASAPSARSLATARRALGYDPEPGLIVSARGRQDFRRPAGRRAVVALGDRIARDPAVGRVETTFSGRGLPFLLADGGRETLILVHFRSSDTDALKPAVARLRRLARLPGARVDVDGYAAGFLEVARLARSDLVRADLIAIPALFLLLLVLFRRPAAAAVPVAIGGVAVVGTLAGLRLLAAITDVSIFALNLGVLLGLGLATDYGLLLVSRFREESRRAGAGQDAVAATLGTAGRTVAVSGAAVAGAFASLLVFPQPFIASMGLAGMLVAAIASATALIVAPPLLLLLGSRIGTGQESGGSGWMRWTGWVVRRRRDVAVATSALLIAAAAPALALRSTFSDHRSLPSGNQVRTVGDTITRDYAPNLQYPVTVTVPLRGRTPDVALLPVARAPGVSGFRALDARGGDVAIGQVLLADGPTAPRAQAVVRLLRRLGGGLRVAGRTAEFSDLKTSIRQRAPLAVGIAGLASLLALVALTGSLVLPLKALAFNALGISATFGLLVLVFQHGGHGIDLAAAVVIVAATFGLASDYAILLLARIVEAHEAGRPDEEAIADGLRRSGPVITRAALLICIPLLAQATSRIPLVRQLGIGQTLGVALDATLIRLLLVPATMALLGPANWWAPRSVLRARERRRRVAP